MHRELIEQLGDGTRVAEKIAQRIGRPFKVHRVYKWKENGVAWPYRPLIAEFAQEQGVELPSGFLLPGPVEAAPSEKAQ